MRDIRYDWIFYGLIVAVLCTVGAIIIEFADWEYICTSFWRFSKNYSLTCVLKGYPLFP